MNPAFEVMLPPGATRVDLTGDVDAALTDALAPYVRAAPLTRQPVVRRLLEDRVRPAIRELATTDSVCAVIAANPYVDNPVRPVIVFTPIAVGRTAEHTEAVDPIALLHRLGQDDPSSTIVPLGDLVALRTDGTADVTSALESAARPMLAGLAGSPSSRNEAAGETEAPGPGLVAPASDVATATPDADVRVCRVHVQYLVASRTAGDHVMAVHFTADYPTTAVGAELAQAETELFDAVMTTFRWLP